MDDDPVFENNRREPEVFIGLPGDNFARLGILRDEGSGLRDLCRRLRVLRPGGVRHRLDLLRGWQLGACPGRRQSKHVSIVTGTKIRGKRLVQFIGGRFAKNLLRQIETLLCRVRVTKLNAIRLIPNSAPSMHLLHLRNK
jgi:hypothetical protein